MTDYVAHGGIKIARSLHDLVRDEIAPGTGVAPDTVWTLLDSIVRTLGPRNRALLEKRDALQAKIDAWLGARRGGSARAEGDGRVLARDRLSRARRAAVQGDDRQRRSRDRDARRAAARRARRQRALRAERGERALGQPLRRALRHERDSRGRRRRERPRLQPRARRARDRERQRIPRRGRAARRRASGPTSPALDVDGRDARAAACATAAAPRSPTRRSSPASAARATRSRTCCCAITVCTSTSRSTSRIRSASSIRPASRTSCSRAR